MNFPFSSAFVFIHSRWFNVKIQRFIELKIRSTATYLVSMLFRNHRIRCGCEIVWGICLFLGYFFFYFTLHPFFFDQLFQFLCPTRIILGFLFHFVYQIVEHWVNLFSSRSRNWKMFHLIFFAQLFHFLLKKDRIFVSRCLLLPFIFTFCRIVWVFNGINGLVLWSLISQIVFVLAKCDCCFLFCWLFKYFHPVL